MQNFFMIVLIIICILIFLYLKTKSWILEKKSESIFWEYINYLYKKDYIMTKRENQFFQNLSEYIKDKDYLICPKVRLEDIIWVRSTHRGFRPWKASSRLDRAHVDFILIGKTDFMTKMAIELDDSTHDNSYWRDHDRAKNEAFEKVGVKLLRFRNSDISHEELRNAWIV